MASRYSAAGRAGWVAVDRMFQRPAPTWSDGRRGAQAGGTMPERYSRSPSAFNQTNVGQRVGRWVAWADDRDGGRGRRGRGAGGPGRETAAVFVETTEQTMLRQAVRKLASGYGHTYFLDVSRAGRPAQELWTDLG